MVRKAAKLAVYEEIIIIVKNHQIPATIRVDVALHLKKNERSTVTIPNYDVKFGRTSGLNHNPVASESRS